MKYYKGRDKICAEKIELQTNILGYSVIDKLTSLETNGVLTIDCWYPWDGNSGPFPDLKSTIEASAGHDVLCDYINSGFLPCTMQPLVDQFYYDHAVSKGLWPWVARQVVLFIRWYMLKKGDKKYFRKLYDSETC